MAEKILIVDDERDLVETLAYRFREAGYEVAVSQSGEGVVAQARLERPDLIILDLMLPDLPGTEVCRRLLAEPATHHIPVVVLSARGDEVDRIVGFELGATDYVVKPFSTRELVLRVRAILRRVASAGVQTDRVVTLGPVTVDAAAHRVLVDGAEASLTAREFRVLETLVRRRGRVLSREELLDAAWPDGAEVMERSVDALVMRIRTKLGEAGPLVETVRGVGYRARST